MMLSSMVGRLFGYGASRTDHDKPVTFMNVAAYLLSCFCSIAFLVFLNAMQSFVLTVLLKLKDNIGNYVGTLGFIDEIVSVVMCPVWGTLSDKIGTRTVCSIAYVLVGVSLMFFVQAREAYPDLIFLRMFFALGGSATAAMVTALLAEVSSYKLSKGDNSQSYQSSSDSSFPLSDPSVNSASGQWYDNQQEAQEHQDARTRAHNGKLSGLVGLSTGLGAVLAVTVFLPIPSRLERRYDMSPEDSLKASFYIVGSIAIVVSIILFATLRQDPTRGLLKWVHSIRYSRRRRSYLASRARLDTLVSFDDTIGEDGGQRLDNSPASHFGNHEEDEYYGQQYLEEKNSYFRLLIKGFTAAAEPSIFLAYVGGLIARSASVAVSLFIPLYINQWFYSEGLCVINDGDVKQSCRDAYILSAMLTGVSETVALLTAPLWGIACDRLGKKKSLAVASVIGAIGFFGFSAIANPRNGMSFLWASFIGVSQIGAIVCSLSLCTERRTEYSGSIAGVYSVTGAAGILLLTKLGGWASDKSRGAPFILMAIFNVILFVCAIWNMYVDGDFSGIKLLGADQFVAHENRILNPRISYVVDNSAYSHDEHHSRGENDSDDEDPTI
ncbi:major facilitator superfamily domain-containing protein [Dipodascopsis uninucleata]